MPTINGLGVYQEIGKLEDMVKICFLTAGDLKDEEFTKQIFPTSIKEDQFIEKPVNNEVGKKSKRDATRITTT